MSAKVLGSIAWFPPLDLPDPEVVDGLERNVAKLRRVYDDTAPKAEAIKTSRDLTAEGRLNALLALGKEAQAALDKITASINYQALIDATEREMVQTRKPLDATLQAREQEIRSHVLAMEDALKDAQYRVAALEGDEEYLSAIDRAPKFLLNRLVSPKVRDEMREARLAAKYPQKWETLQMWKNVAQSWKDATYATRAALKDAGVRFADPALPNLS